MASFVYNSFWADMLAGTVDIEAVDVNVMLVTSGYSANKDTHNRRDDVTNEVTGTGYTAGGATSVGTITRNDSSDLIIVEFDAVNWTTATITARAAVYYVARGGASSADELILYNDFGANVVVTAGTFTVAPVTITVNNA
jgi:hypothetical protein